MTVLRTQRLLLRPWRDEDRAPWAEMNADPVVREHFAATLSREESDAQAARNQSRIEQQGFGQWAVEAPGLAPFIGAVGIQAIPWPAPFEPNIELAWRLARPFWSRGYAIEAARAVAAHAFGPLGLAEVVAYTALANWRSQRVMATLGMTHDPAEDFDHPTVPDGNPARRQVLYRLRRP